MKIIVTGGFGFIGSYVVEDAILRGHDVLVVDKLTYAGSTENLADMREHFTFVTEDICNSLSMSEVFGGFKPDCVIHLAAETHVTRSITIRDEFLRTNVWGTHALLEAALRNGSPHFVHVSTDEVYGSLGPNEAKWTEASCYRPNNPYAASKAASDHLVRAYARTFGLSAAICHSANNFGHRQHPEKVIPTFIWQALAGKHLTLHGTGTHSRDWLYVADHAASLLKVAEARAEGVFNFPGAGELSNVKMARLILDAAGDARNRFDYIPDRPGNDQRYAMEPGMFAEATVTLPSMIPELVEWHATHPNYELRYGR